MKSTKSQQVRDEAIATQRIRMALESLRNDKKAIRRVLDWASSFFLNNDN